MRKEVAEDIRTILNAPDRATVEACLTQMVAKHADTASKLSAWMEENVPEGLMMFSFPKRHQNLLRITNVLEYTGQENKLRARIAYIFPDEASCLRLISAILMETNEEWEMRRVYLSVEDD